mmetsp:Transcript_86913/g.153681  ORF Transcript_86913/g.153681 Transcript_86913/m.153681 type:complete len:613 (+) Transcript_86913:107-1945(+)
MVMLPHKVQATIDDVQRYYELMQKDIINLQLENAELKKILSSGDHGASNSKTIMMLAQENDELRAKLAMFEPSPLPGSPENISLGVRKVTDADVNARIVQNHASKGSKSNSKEPRGSMKDPDSSNMANDKFNRLRSDPFSGEGLMSLEDSEDGDGSMTAPTSEKISNAFYNSKHRGDCMQKFTEATFFNTVSILAIAANTIYLGAAADFNVKNSYKRLEGLTKEESSMVPDIIFTSWFTLEILIKILAYKVDFFTGPDKGWNLFDGALVAESLVTLITSLTSGSQGNSKFSFLRIFRCFRLVRVVRVVRTVKALARLRTMIFAILNSFIDLLWAFLVVMLIIFVFAIIFDGAVATYFDAIDPLNTEQMVAAEGVHALFGTMLDTMLSLWSAVSGGNDWMTYGEALLLLDSPAYFAIFNFYVAFCVVGLFNVVTGVFVDSAVCVRTGDEVVQGYLEDLRSTTSEIKTFFKEADKDGSGTLSWEEFQSHMKDPAVKAYFAGLEIDPEEAGIIFTILDEDRSNEILIDEFVNGTMKLKGSATRLDLVALMYDLNKQNIKVDNLTEFIESELREIKRVCVAAPTPTNGRQKTVAELPRAVAIPLPKGDSPEKMFRR